MIGLSLPHLQPRNHRAALFYRFIGLNSVSVSVFDFDYERDVDDQYHTLWRWSDLDLPHDGCHDGRDVP